MDPATILWGWRINEVVSLVVCGLAILYLVVSMTRRPRPALVAVGGAGVVDLDDDESVEDDEPAALPPISPADVAHVARLARLELTADEIERYTEQLGTVIEHFHDIDELDLADVVPMYQPLPLQNVFRDDVVGPDARPRRGAGGRPRGRGRALPRPADPGRGAVTPPVDATGEPTTVVGIAEAVRSGATSAAAVVESHLARIGAREPDVHAFNLVLADEARAAAAAIDERIARGEDPGPLAGVPIALKDNLCTRGIATTCSSRILDGWRPPYDATVVERLAAAGRRHRRQDQPRRVRHGLLDRELRLRPDPQPARPDPGARVARRAAAPRPWPPGSRPGRSDRTPAARSASRPPSAASSA